MQSLACCTLQRDVGIVPLQMQMLFITLKINSKLWLALIYYYV